MNQRISPPAPTVSMSKPLPSIDLCLGLMDEYDMLKNIREHSFVVARTSETILKNLQLYVKPEDLPPKTLVIAGALLHDIAKTGCLAMGGDHAKIGGEICDKHGYAEIAEIVREHVWLVNFSPARYKKNVFQAKEIVYYADKRVLHDKIVDLSQRLDYILERYGNNDPLRHSLIEKNFNQCQELENWLCRSAECTADELLADVSSLPYIATQSQDESI